MNLASVFFAPNYSELLPLFIETAKSFKFSSDVNPYSFNRLKTQYNQFGIELFITDEFLSELRNEKVDVSTILRENKKTLMSSGILSLI